MERDLRIDMLKNIACFGVVALHTFAPTKLPNAFYYIFVFAIPIFFMVNGYLLLNKKELTYPYIIKKIFNILLTILIWNVFFSCAILVAKHQLINPLLETIKNLLQKGFFYQFWFFGSLILIYSILPLLHSFLNKNSKRYTPILIILILICLIIDITNLILGSMHKPIFTAQVIQSFRLWTWLMYFILGGYLGKQPKVENKKNIPYAILLLTLTILVTVYQLLVANNIFNDFRAEYFYDNILVILYTILIWKMVCSFHYDKFSKYISFINSCTMGIYILHLFFIKAIGKFYAYHNLLINIFVYILILGVCIGISTIINKIPKLNRILRI